MTHDGLYLLTAAIALFEIGANAALIEKFYGSRGRLRYPITGKMIAVSMMLAYMALSVLFGSPPVWRVTIALISVTADGAALIWIWWALRQGRSLDGRTVFNERYD
jgi:hypothetical protein